MHRINLSLAAKGAILIAALVPIVVFQGISFAIAIGIALAIAVFSGERMCWPRLPWRRD